MVARRCAISTGVLSLGGGALTETAPAPRSSRPHVAVVLLRATASDAGDPRRRRPHPAVACGTTRAARLAVLAEARRPSYDEVATLSVDTDDRTPGQVAATVASRLHDLGPV